MNVRGAAVNGLCSQPCFPVGERERKEETRENDANEVPGQLMGSAPG